jgi:c-di-GMP-binding flagellar brake protein YcgR
VKDKRKHLRITLNDTVINFEVQKKEIAIRYCGNIVDLGEGGIGIKSEKFPNKEDLITVDIVLIDHKKEKYIVEDIRCNVAWVNKEEQRFGLQFVDIPEEVNKTIKKYITSRANN